MAQSSTIDVAYAVGSILIASNETRSADTVNAFDISLPAGFDGLMSGTTVVDELITGHGLIATDVIDIHWDDPSTGDHKSRRGYVVDTANANDVVFNETPAPEGDPLPADDTVVVISKQVILASQMSIDGDAIVMAAMGASERCVADIRSSGGSLQLVQLVNAGSWGWLVLRGDPNPFAGATLILVHGSNGSTVDTVLKVGIHYDE